MAGLSQGTAQAQSQAEHLNSLWEALGKTYDAYYDSLPKKVQDTLRAAQSNWQDFYYGSDEFPVDKLNHWTTIYAIAAQTLKAGIPAGAATSSGVTALPQVPASKVDAVFNVTGKRDVQKFDFKLPPWQWWALGALPALAILYLTRKTGL